MQTKSSTLIDLEFHLRNEDLDVDARKVASAILALYREKVQDRNPAQLFEWIEQLALDLALSSPAHLTRAARQK